MWIFGWKGPSGFSASSTAEQAIQGIDGTSITATIVTGLLFYFSFRSIKRDWGQHSKSSCYKRFVCGNGGEENHSAKVAVMQIDLSEMTSIRKIASEYISSGRPLNILINNAAVAVTPFTLSEDNIELQFATNHVGHFLLTDLLLETMKNTARESNQERELLNVSSIGHHHVYCEGVCFHKINDQSG